MAASRSASRGQGGGGAPGARPVVRAAGSLLLRLLNPLVVAFAGTRRLKFFAVIQHRGRRSGRVYFTPVAARPAADGFVIPLTFGEDADWFQNLRAAGGGVIRWNGKQYPVIDPAVVDRAAARVAFGPFERFALRLIGIEWFGRVWFATATADTPAHDGHAGSHAPHEDAVALER